MAGKLQTVFSILNPKTLLCGLREVTCSFFLILGQESSPLEVTGEALVGCEVMSDSVLGVQWSAGTVLYVAWIWLGPSSPLSLTQQHFAASCRKPSLATFALGSGVSTGLGTPLHSPFPKICMLYPKPLSAQHTTPDRELSFRPWWGLCLCHYLHLLGTLQYPLSYSTTPL